MLAGVPSVRLTAGLVAGLIAMAGCGGSEPGGASPTTSSGRPEAEFTAPEPTGLFLRALRTDLCALIDQALVSQLGWQASSSKAQTLVACGAATEDLTQSMSIELDVTGSQQDGPASGDTCYRVRTIESASRLAVKAIVTSKDDPCGLAERFAAAAAQRFAANAGAVEPPNPWIALDACEVLRPALAGSAAALGGPKPSSTRLRRIGVRGCLASHQNGTAELSLTPVVAKAADIEGDEVAVAGRKARVQQRTAGCGLLLVGDQMGGGGKRTETQVITMVITADGRDPAGQCELAQAMAETVAAGLPA